VAESFRDSLLGSLIWIFCGAILGGRVGYALLYAPQYFWSNPFAVFFPFENGIFVGFFGMSFFGGVIGVIMVLWLSSFWSFGSFFLRSDYLALVAPLAIFCGRIGNFMNGELLGRVTTVPWGMYFPFGGVVLRHPSQLYEAMLEGIILFLILWHTRKVVTRPGMLSVIFLFCYGALRFFAEFFREPDFGEGFFLQWFTQGQLYSILLMLCAGYLLYSIRRKKGAILKG
jgi:phosphatidylglycerol:prolipoprotein diacylglycerol transferase